MATIEKRIADLELRVGTDVDVLRLVIIKPVQDAAQGCVVKSLTIPDSGRTWSRSEDESEAGFVRRVRSDLELSTGNTVLLVANSEQCEVAA